ncbi:MAG: hypothetical protein CMF22_10110 [Idiomarinaceae bacterium]|nr:hypothetical protein [Idiomarinaceae bacterium]MBG23795.1 hypothetical protein [Idiomarinaceae bacterium]|tara:strand:+ start:49429 stop:50529 length:1101 start_codon:yes stop_codon:yes gene_type:complete
MTKPQEVKAKRRIKKFDFDYNGSHCALVGPSVGGAANQHTTLITKATNGVTDHAPDEEIQKAVNVNLKLPLMEFLTRYLYVDIDAAETIAGMLGYSYEDIYEVEDDITSFREMVQSNMDKVTSIDSNSDETGREERIRQAEEFIENFNSFDEKYFVEKSLGETPKGSSSSVEKGGEVNTEDETNVKQEETQMTKEADIQKSEVEIELEKAREQLAELEKAKEDAEKAKQEKADLEKSFKEVNETVAVLKAAEERRKEEHYLAKAKEHTLVVTEENPAEELAKALRIAEETEGCEALVKAFEAYRDTATKGDMLEEIGKAKTDDQPSGSKLDAAIEKAKEAHSVDYLKALDIVQREQPELFAEEYRF